MFDSILVIRDIYLRMIRQGGFSVDQTAYKTDFFVIKALEDGVKVIGLTRGTDTKFHHSEKLDKGEIMIAQFTEHTSAVKIRGRAVIQTAYGEMHSDADSTETNA